MASSSSPLRLFTGHCAEAGVRERRLVASGASLIRLHRCPRTSAPEESQPRLAPRSLRPELELEPGPCAHLAHAARTPPTHSQGKHGRSLSLPARKKTHRGETVPAGGRLPRTSFHPRTRSSRIAGRPPERLLRPDPGRSGRAHTTLLPPPPPAFSQPRAHWTNEAVPSTRRHLSTANRFAF